MTDQSPQTSILNHQTGTETPGWIDRYHRLALIALIALGIMVRALRARDGDTFFDGMGYIMIARNILAGHLITPWFATEVQLQFPPLYPLIIAAMRFITGDLFTAARVVNIIAGTMLALPVHDLTRRIYGARPALFAAALVLFHPYLVQMGSNAHCEPTYLLFAMTGFAWIWRSAVEGKWRGAVAGGLALALATMVRTQGLSLLPALLIAIGAARTVHPAGFAPRFLVRMAVVVLAFWCLLIPYRRIVESQISPGQLDGRVWQELQKKTSYFPQPKWLREERTLTPAGDRFVWLDQARQGPRWTIEHPREYISRVIRDLAYLLRVLPGRKLILPVILIPLLFQAVRGGRTRSIRSAFGAGVLVVAVGTVSAVALVAVNFERYLIVIVPFAAITAGAGLDGIARAGERAVADRGAFGPIAKLLPAALLAAVIIASLAWAPSADSLAPGQKPDFIDRETAAWIAPRLDPDRPTETIMSCRPGVQAVLGDSYRLFPADTPARTARYARLQGAGYLILDDCQASMMDQEENLEWTEAIAKGALADVGLELVDSGRFPRADRPEVTRQVHLIKVLPVPKKPDQPLSWSTIEMLEARPTKSDRPPNIILISLDTLRSDHLGCYGHDRDTSPNLDFIAAHGVRFRRVISQSPKTAPSHMTMFTGLYPSQHHVQVLYRNNLRDHSYLALAPDRHTLAEWLHDAGYRTAAWTGDGEVAAEAGFSRGFDQWSETTSRLTPESFDPALEWLRQESDQPAFLFLHTYQIHDPYLPPAPYNQMFDPGYQGWISGDREEVMARAGSGEYSDMYQAFWGLRSEDHGHIAPQRFSKDDLRHLQALYDGNIRFTDKIIGDFIARLIREGLMTNTVVIITADHGEEFSEHGGFIHQMLYRETLQVPMIIFAPGRLPAGRTVPSQVRLIDVSPTLLELAGVPVPDQVRGESLLPLTRPGTNAPDRPAYSEGSAYLRGHFSLRDDGCCIYRQGDDGDRLFDLRRDPRETRDIAPTKPEILEKMSGLLDDFAATLDGPSLPGPDPQPLSPERIEQLRALGYIK